MKRILVIDVGGTNLKVSTAERRESLKIPSGKSMTAARMAAAVRQVIEGWKYDAVSIGYPGSIKRGKPAHEPHNLSGGWMRFDYEKAFGAPVKIVNDAAMQALGAYAGGRMLFLGLGTGLGSALVAEGLLVPLELAHLPYRRGRTYEDYVGMRGFHATRTQEVDAPRARGRRVVAGCPASRLRRAWRRADEEAQDAAARSSDQRQSVRDPRRPAIVGRARARTTTDLISGSHDVDYQYRLREDFRRRRVHPAVERAVWHGSPPTRLSRTHDRDSR